MAGDALAVAEPGDELMRVLIYTPVYRLEPETVHAVLSLDRDGHETQTLFDHTNPYHGDPNDTILEKYQRMQDVFIAGDWDAVLVIESDIIPPVDALRKLAAVVHSHGADVVNGLYYFRRSAEPVANAVRMTRDARWVDQSWTMFPQEMHMWVNKIIPVTGLGLGCSLIMGHVLHGVRFRSGGLTACDWSFANDLLAGGYRMYADTTVRCGHKMPDGRIIWPDDAGGYYYTDGDASCDYHLNVAKESVRKARHNNGATINTHRRGAAG